MCCPSALSRANPLAACKLLLLRAERGAACSWTHKRQNKQLCGGALGHVVLICGSTEQHLRHTDASMAARQRTDRAHIDVRAITCACIRYLFTRGVSWSFIPRATLDLDANHGQTVNSLYSDSDDDGIQTHDHYIHKYMSDLQRETETSSTTYATVALWDAALYHHQPKLAHGTENEENHATLNATARHASVQLSWTGKMARHSQSIFPSSTLTNTFFSMQVTQYACMATLTCERAFMVDRTSTRDICLRRYRSRIAWMKVHF